MSQEGDSEILPAEGERDEWMDGVVVQVMEFEEHGRKRIVR